MAYEPSRDKRIEDCNLGQKCTMFVEVIEEGEQVLKETKIGAGTGKNWVSI